MRLYAESANVQFKYAKGMTDIYGKTFHDSYEIFLMLSGNAEFISDRTRLNLRPFQLVCIPPGRYHQFCVHGSASDYERIVLNFNSSFDAAKICKEAFEENEIMSLDKTGRIVSDFLYLKESFASVNEEDFRYILDAVATDIAFLIKNSGKKEKTLRGNLRSVSVEAMEYINSRFTEDFSVEQLADVLHISTSSISHIFKADFGISIKKYILQKRMNSAHLAIIGGKRAEEAALMCGYNNYSNFYRSYVKYFGVSPSEDVKKNKK